jgi:glycosyltransferase involved in cell wall biosynthesis
MQWEYMTQRPQQLMREFARLGYRIIFHSGQNEVKAGIKEVAPNLYVCNRDISPLKHIRIDDPPILWISWPPYVKLIGKYYGEQMVVFDCVDAAAGEFADWAKGLDEILVKADLVLTASQLLYEKYKDQYPEKTYLCRNGVDSQHFTQPQSLAPELTGIKRPIIGYHGALAPWINWELVRNLAEKNPDYSFVFVGPPYEMSSFPQEKNIHYLGYQPYTRLPEFVQGFDVGIIPFQITEMTVYSCPIKMYEYLASGVPVVSTDLPDVRSCEQVLIAKGAQEFSLKISEALALRSDSNDSLRKSFASQNSWDMRAQFALNRVESVLQNKMKK